MGPDAVSAIIVLRSDIIFEIANKHENKRV